MYPFLSFSPVFLQLAFQNNLSGEGPAVARTGFHAAARLPALKKTDVRQRHSRSPPPAHVELLPFEPLQAPPRKSIFIQNAARSMLHLTCAVLDDAPPQPAPPQAGQVPHDQQVPPPSGQGDVHPLF